LRPLLSGGLTDLAGLVSVRQGGTHFALGIAPQASIHSSETNHNMSVNIKPLADRVVVEPAAAEEKTASGSIIPDTAKEKPQRGTVVAVGAGKPDEPMTVKVGDTVLYGKYSGTELTLEEGDFMIMRESDILAIL